MPRVVQIEVYSFQELLDELNATEPRSPEFQGKRRIVQKVQEQLSLDAVDDSTLVEPVWDNLWKPALEQIGFQRPRVDWTNLGSDGGGATFTSDSVDVAQIISFLTGEFTPDNKEKPVISGPKPGHSEAKIEDFRPWLRERLGRYLTKGEAKDLQQLLLYAETIDVSIVLLLERSYVGPGSAGLRVEYLEPIPLHLGWLKWLFEEVLERLRVDVCRAIYADLVQSHKQLLSVEHLARFDSLNGFCWLADGQRLSVTALERGETAKGAK